MSLELKTEYGEPPVLLQDGKPIGNVKLVSIEVEAGEQPVIQVELYPGVTAIHESGIIHWIVCCPNCEHNSVHTCEIDDSLEPADRKIDYPPEVPPVPTLPPEHPLDALTRSYQEGI